MLECSFCHALTPMGAQREIKHIARRQDTLGRTLHEIACSRCGAVLYEKDTIPNALFGISFHRTPVETTIRLVFVASVLAFVAWLLAH
jgi:hypothetical protein